MAHEVAGKYQQSVEALRSPLESHPWATRGPTVLAMLQQKLETRVVSEVLTGMDATQRTKKEDEERALSEKKKGAGRKNSMASGSTPVRSSRNKRARRKGKAAEEKPEK